MKQRLLKAQRFLCADCGYDGPLELHHLEYPQQKLLSGEFGSWGDEEDTDCVCLCRDCHHQRHIDVNGDFWADPLELEHYWWSNDD